MWDTSSYLHVKKKNTYKRISDRLKREAKLLKTVEKKSFLKKVKDAEIVFNNTVTNSSLLRLLPLKGKRVFHYFHEMQVICDMSVSAEDLNYQYSIAEKIVVPAKTVKDFYTSYYRLSANRFATLRYVVPEINHTSSNVVASNENKFQIGFSGSLNWRKGYDLLPLLIKEIVFNRKVTDVEFVWLGATKGTLEYAIIHHDLAKLKLEGYLKMVPIQNDIMPLLYDLDIFVLPSKEDAFPLVVLEAAAVEKPCVYFKQAGGIGEFVKDDAGMAVDYLDIVGMADAILLLKNDPLKLNQMGLVARQRVLSYINTETIVNDFLELLSPAVAD